MVGRTSASNVRGVHQSKAYNSLFSSSSSSTSSSFSSFTSSLSFSFSNVLVPSETAIRGFGRRGFLSDAFLSFLHDEEEEEEEEEEKRDARKAYGSRREKAGARSKAGPKGQRYKQIFGGKDKRSTEGYEVKCH